jgi:hypothetical protein
MDTLKVRLYKVGAVLLNIPASKQRRHLAANRQQEGPGFIRSKSPFDKVVDFALKSIYISHRRVEARPKNRLYSEEYIENALDQLERQLQMSPLVSAKRCCNCGSLLSVSSMMEG